MQGARAKLLGPPIVAGTWGKASLDVEIATSKFKLLLCTQAPEMRDGSELSNSDIHLEIIFREELLDKRSLALWIYSHWLTPF